MAKKQPFRLEDFEADSFFQQGLTFEFSALQLSTQHGLLAHAPVAATNLILAAELYLKVLASLDGRDPIKTHDLLMLYEDLEPSTRDVVASRWPKAEAGMQELINAGNMKYGLPAFEVPSERYVDLITRSRRFFEDLRYPTEVSWVSSNLRLASPLREEVLNRKPEWHPSADDPREKLLRAR